MLQLVEERRGHREAEVGHRVRAAPDARWIGNDRVEDLALVGVGIGRPVEIALVEETGDVTLRVARRRGVRRSPSGDISMITRPF